MRTCSALALAIAALGGCVSDDPVRTHVEALLVGVPCADEAATVVREWGAGLDFLEGPPTAGGARTFRFPTETLGEWVVLTVHSEEPPSVVRVTADGASARVFAADCSAEPRERPHGVISTDTTALFTDAHLQAHIDAAEVAVVIYVWAPHMPLSTDGYVEARAAGQPLGLDVVPVLMAFSDRTFAEREAERAGIPPEGLRQIDSNELVQRQAQVHAPSIVIFTGERVSPVLPGYRNAEGYSRYLKAFLESSP